MALTKAGLLDRLTSAYNTNSGSNVDKLMAAFYDGIWLDINTNITDLRTQMFIKTATGGTLDKYAKVVKLARKSGESDASLLLRIKGAIRRHYGGHTLDEIKEFVEALIGASEGSVKLYENLNPTTGKYEPATYYVEFSIELLGTLGFPTSEWAATITEVETILAQSGPAGVKGRVKTTGGFLWDTDTWDSASKVWGS